MSEPFIFQNLFYDTNNGQPLATVKTQNYTIFQVADSYYLSDFTINGHTQPCDLEITHVLHGSIECATDGVPLRVEKNEGYITLKRDLHALNAKNSCRFQTLAINVNEGSPSFKLLADIQTNYADPNQRRYKLHGASSLFSMIVSEFSTPPDGYFERALDGAITSLLSLLARGQTVSREFKHCQSQELLSEIMRYVDEHFLQINSLFELSERFGYSYNYLCGVFKKQYGKTLREYLLTKKLDYAKELLLQGKKVWEVAENTGYSNPYNFSRSFKKHHGVSPEVFLLKTKP